MRIQLFKVIFEAGHLSFEDYDNNHEKKVMVHRQDPFPLECSD